jgi:hypothetical protein
MDTEIKKFIKLKPSSTPGQIHEQNQTFSFFRTGPARGKMLDFLRGCV